MISHRELLREMVGLIFSRELLVLLLLVVALGAVYLVGWAAMTGPVA